MEMLLTIVLCGLIGLYVTKTIRPFSVSPSMKERIREARRKKRIAPPGSYWYVFDERQRGSEPVTYDDVLFFHEMMESGRVDKLDRDRDGFLHCLKEAANYVENSSNINPGDN